ncbi:LysE family translocator [Lamprobacter modestohalophilus]|uniref:LysE family translocator n=1 Tax=Lamprobacter modestohalophilus TaxID=1064514 RepID=UPI002ADEDED9|nr:LysE family translocator [Lamprobacter modestohalophilus]MEA1052248.1 LysE family translocator [Lamprobacter modestohalophilus]
MSLEESLILFATLAVLAALPSASVVLVVTRSAAAGLRQGLAVALGIVLGDLLFVAIALLGLTALADALGGLFLLIKLLGGLYLIWLGSTMLFSRSSIAPANAGPDTASGLIGSVVAGLLLTLGDLKAILFYASLFPLFVNLEAVGSADLLLIILITALSVGGVKLVYAVAVCKLAAVVPGRSPRSRCPGWRWSPATRRRRHADRVRAQGNRIKLC